MNIKENLTRIIGIILVIISIYAMKEVSIYTVLLLIPAAVMAIAGKKLAQKEFKRLLISFNKIKEKKFFLISFYDTMFWFIMAAAAYGLGILLAQQYNTLIPEPDAVFSAIKMSVAYLLFTTIFTIAVYTAFKGMIWLTVLNKKAEWMFFVKLFFLNLIWWIIWLIPTIIMLAGTKPGIKEFAIVAWIVIYLHMTTCMHHSFAQKQLIGKSLKNAFTTSFGRIKQFLLPGAYAAAIYGILDQIFLILPKTQNITTFASILLIVFFLAWYRQYMAGIIGKTA